MVHHKPVAYGLDDLPNLELVLIPRATVLSVKLEVYEKVGGKTSLSVTPSVADKVKTCWTNKRYDSEKQKQFVMNVMKIHYSPEDVYCLHRYYIKSHFSIGRSIGYIVGCRNCEFSYPTDTKPLELM